LNERHLVVSFAQFSACFQFISFLYQAKRFVSGETICGVRKTNFNLAASDTLPSWTEPAVQDKLSQ
jgi:hypothetical protein